MLQTSLNTRWKFMGHSWKIMEHSWEIHGTCMGNSWEIHGKFMGNSWEIRGKFIGNYLKIIGNSCKLNGGNIEGSLFANIVFPAPGGPIIITL